VIRLAKNVGKKFEDDFYDSINKTSYVKRARDVVGYAGSVSIADFLIFHDSKKYDDKYLVLAELKTTKGASITVSTKYNKKKEMVSWGRLNWKQMKMMLGAMSKSDNIIAGYIMEFRKTNKCFFIDIGSVIDFLIDPDRTRKSIPVKFLEDNGLTLDRELKSSVWTEEEQQIILNEVGNDYTGKEVVSILKDKLPNRNDSSIKSKFYQLKKTKKIKKVTQYIHYNYNIGNLDNIIEYINNK
jgi:penicillin-binding protein-related factor A (putative recombinase)